MQRIARVCLFVLGGVAAMGCKKSAPSAPGAARFLPATADTAIRIDLTKARAWSGYAKAAPVAFRAIAPAIEAVKRACDFDLIGEASGVMFARRGVGANGDMTLVLSGLPGDKLRACPAKIGVTIPNMEIVPDGDRFTVKTGGKGFASGAILPTGELVIVSRAAASVDPAAWRDEVTSGAAAAPAWWSELDQEQALAVRVHDADRTITASAQVGDPFVVRAKDATAAANIAQVDLARMKAISEFLQKADAGTARVEPRDLTIHADLTATGPQVDHLVTAALSALGAEQPPEVSATDAAPIECTELAAAVGRYMAKSMESMSPDQRIANAPVLEKLTPVLAKAYVDACSIDKWAPQPIHCHVDHAAELPKFEKCRLLLPDDQRKHFDEMVGAALKTAQ